MGSKSNPMYDMSPPPMEIPQAAPVEARPANMQTQFPPSGAGNRAGGIANIAANFLHGMLAGKDVKERKMQETAQFSISSAWQTYQQLQATASDPSAPEDARKMATANLGKAYQVWINNVEQYTQPGDKPKKKGGVLSRMGGALKTGLTAQKPTMGTEDMLALYKSPQMIQMMSQPHGASPEQQKAQIDLQQTQKAVKQMDAIDAKTQELNGILEKGMSTDDDRSKATNTLTQIQALKGELKEVPDPQSEAAKRARDKVDVAEGNFKSKLAIDASAAYDKKQRGQPLTPTEQQVLSAYMPEGKTDPFQIYQNMIGKRATNKLTGRPVDIKDDKDALDLYLSDQAYWAKVGKNPSEYEMQTADVKNAIRSSLRSTLGREPNDDEVRSKWLDYMTAGTKKGAEDKPRQLPTAEKGAIQQQVYSDLQANDRWKKFVGAGASKGSMRILPRSQFNKDDQGEYDQMLQEVGHQLADRGYSAEDIREVTGGAGFGMSQTPPSMAGKAGPKGVGPTKKYKVSSGSQSTEEEMTQQEADEMKKANPNWKVEEAAAK